MDELTTSHDYQDRMSVDTRAVDTIGEQAAAAVDEHSAPVGVETVKERRGHWTLVKTVGTFGVLPRLEVSSEHASERAEAFEALALATARSGPEARATKAYASQLSMAGAYLKDVQSLSDAQRTYDLLVPLTSLAVRSFAKTHAIGEHLGVSDLVAPALGRTERRALRVAARGRDPIAHALGLRAAFTGPGGLLSARTRVNAAATAVAAVVRTEVVEALVAERTRATADAAAITAKIARARAIVGAIEAAGTTIAGVAGAAVGLGPQPTLPPDLRDPAARHVQGAGVAAGGGVLGAVVGAGMELAHHDALAKLEATIAVATSLIEGDAAERAALELRARLGELSAATDDYRGAVEVLQVRMNDRRAVMATLGRDADRAAGARGASSAASDALLWSTTVMETHVLLGGARAAGEAARADLGGYVSSVLATRDQYWGTLDDAYGAYSLPRREGTQAPDVSSLLNMRRQVARWLEGAEAVATTIDHVAHEQAAPTLALVGFTGSY